MAAQIVRLLKLEVIDCTVILPAIVRRILLMQ